MPRLRPTPVLLALPALLLAAAGLLHPHHLDYATSERWWTLHLPGLLVFPLVGAALAALVRGRRDALAWAVRVAAYVYACFYTALDVVSGIAAGFVTHRLGPGVPRPPAVSQLFAIGTPLGRVGEWALLACVLLVAADALRRHRVRAAGALLLLPGTWLVHRGHIFAPVGVAGMLLIAVGTAWVAALLPGATRASSRDGATESG
ncbi:MAG: hypothetical protein ACXVEC_03535 [Nocardioides sp.]